MAISEAARHDLYTGLSELLGAERTEILMSALPVYDLDEVATKSDIESLRLEINHRTDNLESRVGRIEDALAAVTLRLDRLLYAMIAGLVAILAALAGIMVNL